MKGQLIRLNDGRPVVCVGGDDAVFCLLADLPQDSDSETKQVRAEMSKALGREATAKAGREKAERKEAAMLAAIKRATSMLPHAEAQEVREVYAKCIS